SQKSCSASHFWDTSGANHGCRGRGGVKFLSKKRKETLQVSSFRRGSVTKSPTKSGFLKATKSSDLNGMHAAYRENVKRRLKAYFGEDNSRGRKTGAQLSTRTNLSVVVPQFSLLPSSDNYYLQK